MKEIPLTQGKVALVDDCDFERLSRFRWYAACNHGYGWYAVRCVKRKHVYMHCEILNVQRGIRVDHKDGNGLHNWRNNLRPATSAQNMSNRGKQIDNTSGYKGVTWSKDRSVWIAKIGVNGKSKYLGWFDDTESAARAYNDAALMYHREFAKLNEIIVKEN